MVLIILSFESLVFSNYDEPTKNFFHFSISAGITLSTGIGVELIFDSLSTMKQVVLIGTVGMSPGIVKEIIDYNRGFEFSLADIGYDALGVSLGLIVTISVNKLIGVLHEKANSN